MWIDDQVLQACAKPLSCHVWVPKVPLVVLGRSNALEKEVNMEACAKDAVAIVKRLGGGGTVLLHEGCVVVSLGLWVKEYYANDRYFRLLNQSVIDCLRLDLPQIPFDQRGYSDIVVGPLKVAGTSLFRSRNYLLYQASILVDMRIDWIEKYLSHPSLEPDYRQGRTHRDFLTDLAALGAPAVNGWRQLLEQQLPRCVETNFQNEKIEAQEAQIPHILSRVGEDWMRQ